MVTRTASPGTNWLASSAAFIAKLLTPGNLSSNSARSFLKNIRLRIRNALLASTFQMDKDFPSNAFLILKRMFFRKLRAEFEERFPGVSSIAIDAADEANQLVPGLAVRVTILASVNSGELPLVFSGKRIDGLGQAGSEGFQLIGRALSRAGLPEIGTQVEVFHAEASAFADGAFEVFGPGKIVKFGGVAGKFGFVFARDGKVGAVKISQFAR